MPNYRHIIVVFIALSLMLLADCTSQSEEIRADLGQQFYLAAGQSASIQGEKLTIKFIEVTGDSRCPEGATCIWQGEAKCLVEITYLESLNRITLTQPGLTKEPSKVDFRDYEIEFNVGPYPEVGKQIPAEDYRLQLTVNR